MYRLPLEIHGGMADDASSLVGARVSVWHTCTLHTLCVLYIFKSNRVTKHPKSMDDFIPFGRLHLKSAIFCTSIARARFRILWLR